jgi:hypothetical protein
MQNVFIKHSLVLFVTSYYKNYSVSSTTKLIHRYLLPKIGKLLVYYV